MDYKTEIALEGYELGVFDINPYIPFTWSSGHKMPIRADLKRFLFFPKTRSLISTAFKELIRIHNLSYEGFAGISEGGISPATTLADSLSVPLSYAKEDSPDSIEQKIIDDFKMQEDIILIKDSIFTGVKSIKAIQSIRNQKGLCNKCLSIFDYCLPEAKRAFKELNPKCAVYSLLNYDEFLKIAQEQKWILEEHMESLNEWKKNPFAWGERYGFPPVIKK